MISLKSWVTSSFHWWGFSKETIWRVMITSFTNITKFVIITFLWWMIPFFAEVTIHVKGAFSSIMVITITDLTMSFVNFEQSVINFGCWIMRFFHRFVILKVNLILLWRLCVSFLFDGWRLCFWALTLFWFRHIFLGYLRWFKSVNSGSLRTWTCFQIVERFDLRISLVTLGWV